MNRSQDKGKFGNANLNASTIFAKPPSTQRTGTALGTTRVGGAMTLLGVPKVSCSCRVSDRSNFILSPLTSRTLLADPGQDYHHRNEVSCSEASESSFY